jgi:hypothetical protein
MIFSAICVMLTLNSVLVVPASSLLLAMEEFRDRSLTAAPNLFPLSRLDALCKLITPRKSNINVLMPYIA